MKKLTSVLILICLTLMIAGCGQRQPSLSELTLPEDWEPKATAAATEAPVTEPPATEAPVTEPPATEAPAAEPDFRAEFAPFTVPEQVVFDQYGIKVTTGASGMDEQLGYYVDLIYENSSDNDVTFNWGYCTVNGCMSGWSTCILPVASGETVTNRLYPINWKMDSDMILSTGISHLGEIQVLAGLYLNNMESVDMEPLTIRTSDYDIMDRPAFPAGTICYDDGSLRITIARQNIRDVFGDDFHVLVENNTDRTFNLVPEVLSVNGIPVEGHVGAVFPDIDLMVCAGTSRMFQADLYSKSPEHYGLSDVKEIELRFLFRDSLDWETIYAESDPVTLK